MGLAFLLDLIIGDPPGWPHPVRIIGWFVDKASKAALAGVKNPFFMKLTGVLITFAIAGLTYLAVWLGLNAVSRFSPSLAWVLEIFLAYTALAAGVLVP